MTTTLLYIIVGILVLGFAVVVYFLNKKLEEFKESQKNDQAFSLLNQNIQGMQQRIDRTTENINQRLDSAAKVIGGVQRELGSFQEIGRKMQDLQEFLRSPKLRGNVGEQILKDLLGQMIPKANFQLQYTFSSGEKVDAIIKTRNGLIPIDSKFPMENFQKAHKAESEEEKNLFLKEFFKNVKKHINTMANKYILPQEGTVDFAVMYLPSEAVYYETINNTDIYNYAGDRNIYFVSPNTFYYFLKIIMIALENEKIEERAKEVLKFLRAIQQDSRKFGQELSVLGKHVTNAKNMMDSVSSSYARLGTKIENAGQLQKSQVKEIKNKLPEVEESKEDLLEVEKK